MAMKRPARRAAKTALAAESKSNGPKSSSSKTAARAGATPALDPRPLVQAFLTGERINHVLLDLLEPRVWNLVPPCSQRRTIATTFAHIHNVRCMYVRSARSKAENEAEPLENLDRARVTPDQARQALAASARALAAVVTRACAAGGKVKGVPLDAAGFVCSTLVHEAHHRGQICHWARELGAPIQDQIRIWEWHKLQREIAPV